MKWKQVVENFFDANWDRFVNNEGAPMFLCNAIRAVSPGSRAPSDLTFSVVGGMNNAGTIVGIAGENLDHGICYRSG